MTTTWKTDVTVVKVPKQTKLIKIKVTENSNQSRNKIFRKWKNVRLSIIKVTKNSIKDFNRYYCQEQERTIKDTRNLIKGNSVNYLSKSLIIIKVREMVIRINSQKVYLCFNKSFEK